MSNPPPNWLIIDRAAGDLEGQIHRAIRERILGKRLVSGQRLPSSRALATALGVARTTVVAAYERLLAEGFLAASAGAATRVAPLPDPPEAATGAIRQAQLPLPPEPPDRMGAFRPGIPDLAAFPEEDWARCLSARARHLRVHDLGYGAATGVAELRAAILDHVGETRGVLASPDQVMILPSVATAIAFLARLIRPAEGEPVAWIEEPGYPKAQAILKEAGWRIVPVACDAEGLDASAGNGPSPHLTYVTPSHQYPTGVTMSLPRRLALLALAQASGTVVIEDDYDSEFHYGVRPIAALQGIDRAGCVAYVGTFSKVLAPGLRVAYAILPPRLVASAAERLRLHGSAVPIHVQAALSDFIRDGRLRAHIRRMTPLYADRMRLVAETLERACPDLVDLGPTAGGLQLAAWFRVRATNDRAIAGALHREGFGMRALSDFHLVAPRAGLLFGIASATRERAEAAAAAIRAATRTP